MRRGIAPLLLAGLAAFGYYKYSQMSDEQKNDLKEKGKKFMDDNLGGIKNLFGQGDTQTAGNNRGGQNGFTQG
jgi:hypothetical protein